MGCSTQAWEGCGNTAGQRPHPEFREGQSGSPGGPGPQTELLPAGLFCSGILEPTTQGQDTHEKSWLQQGRGGPEITADGVWTVGP